MRLPSRAHRGQTRIHFFEVCCASEILAYFNTVVADLSRRLLYSSMTVVKKLQQWHLCFVLSLRLERLQPVVVNPYTYSKLTLTIIIATSL